MSREARPGSNGRTAKSARDRQKGRAQEKRENALAWWRRPQVVVFLLAVILAGLGWVMVLDETTRIPVHQAVLGGLRLQLGEARWILDQMDHGENFQKPSTMMPDMPEWGKQRVTLELTLANRAEGPREFHADELELVPELGESVPPMGAQTAIARLEPGQTFHTAVHFDFDTTLPHGRLRVRWTRGGASAWLPIPAPPDHYHLRPRGGEVAFPPRASLVTPLGRPSRGRELYDAVYGCVACHGDPTIPGTNNVGPWLGGVGLAAGERQEGVDAAEYLYRSILDPGDFIAPECKDGRPCQVPTAMPEYASLMNLQDVADVLTYLLELRAEPTEGSPASSEEHSPE